MITVKGVDVGRQTDAASVRGAVRDTNSHNNHASATAVVVAPSQPKAGVNHLGAGCHAEGSGFDIHATAMAQAGIRSFVVTAGGRVVGSYRPSSKSVKRKSLVIHIKGAQFVPGRAVAVVIKVVDQMGRSVHVTRHFSVCQSPPPTRGFTG
jgi:hypothetical protein